MTNPINPHQGLRSYFTYDATNAGTLSGKIITLGIAAVSGVALSVIGGLALKGLILVGIAASYKLGIFICGLSLTSMSISLLMEEILLVDLRNYAINNPTLVLPNPAPVPEDFDQQLQEALFDQELQEALRASQADFVDPNFTEADPTRENRPAFPGVDNFRLLLEDGEHLYGINITHKFDLTFLTSLNNNNPEATDEQAVEFFSRDEHLHLYPNVDPEDGVTPLNRFRYRERFIRDYFNNQLNIDPQAKSQLKQIVQKFLERDPADSNYNTDLGDFILRASSIVGHCSGNFKSQIQALYDKYVEGDVVGTPTERFKKLIYKFLYNYRKEIFTNTVLGICNDPEVIRNQGAHIANSQIYYQRTQGARYGLHFPLALANGTIYDTLRATTNRDGVSIEQCIAQAFERQYTAENIVQRLLTHFNNPGDTNDPIRRALTTGELTRWIERNYNIDTSTPEGGQQIYDLDDDYMPTLKEGIVTLLLHRFQILRVV